MAEDPSETDIELFGSIPMFTQQFISRADEPSFDYLEFHVDRISYLEPAGPGRDRLDVREGVGSR